jgi:hypothetical protein
MAAGFDYGPASALVATGTTALKVETSWVASNATETVTLSQRVSSGNGLQLSAFAVHDISPPALVAAAITPTKEITITWQVMPGFTYTVWHSSDLVTWSPDPTSVFHPTGNAPVDYKFNESITAQSSRFYRLGQSD